MGPTEQSQQASDAAAPAGGGTPPAVDASDVLEVLQDFETGLEAIKSLYKERQRAMTSLKEREQQIVAREATLARSFEEFESTRVAVEQSREEVANLQRELDARAEQLREESRRIEEQRAAAERSAASDRARVESELADLRARVEREVGEARTAAQAEIDRICGETDAKAAAVDARENELNARAAQLESDRAALNELDAEINRKSEEIAARESQLGDLGSAAERLRQQIEDLKGSLSAAAGEIASERERADEQSSRADSIAEELKVALADVDRQKQALADAEDVSAGRGEDRAQLLELIEELDALWAVERSESARLMQLCDRLTREAAEAESAIGVLKDRARGAMSARDDAMERAEAAELTLREATDRVGQLEEKVRTLEAQPARAAAPAPKTAASEARLARRRTRLRNYRAAVKNQAVKIRKANEALGKRYEACEQLLAQRAELAQARVRIVEAERRAQRHKAGTKAAVVAMCVTMTLALLAGLSWAVAREVAPARFMATSELAASERGRTLNDAELAEWQTFHEALLEDPMFHSAAADRFKRQGMTTLASPGQVAELVKAAVTFESAKDGNLRLRLEGMGADRTERELETFTAALASFANAAQQRRVDGGMTEVTQAAKAGADPIDRSRTMYAGAILGGGSLLVFGAAGLIWRKLASAKTAFEQDGQLASTLDEARWVDPRG